MKKTILITGASTGIGHGTALYFAEKGWNVAATMRKPENVKGLTETDSLKKFQLDVQDKSSIQKGIDEAIAAFGKIDVIVNNAGYGAFGPLEAATDEQIRRQFDVNLFGLIDVTKAILPHFRGNKGGTIVNITSIGGRVGTPTGSLYHGTKFAVEGLTEALTYELRPLGIHLKIVEPGGVQTDFAGRSIDIMDTEIPEYQGIIKQMKKLMENPKAMMPSKPIDIAKVIFKAANSSSKRLRYSAGKDARMLFIMKRLFGGAFVRGMIKKMTKI